VRRPPPEVRAARSMVAVAAAARKRGAKEGGVWKWVGDWPVD
jgi:hypothetical protein